MQFSQSNTSREKYHGNNKLVYKCTESDFGVRFTSFFVFDVELQNVSMTRRWSVLWEEQNRSWGKSKKKKNIYHTTENLLTGIIW